MKNTLDDQRQTQVDNNDSAESCYISSTSGRQRFVCTLGDKVIDSENSEIIVCFLNIVCDFWQRGVSAGDAAITRDYAVELPQVLIAVDSLRLLASRLAEWLDHQGDFSLELAAIASGDQSLTFSIGQVDDLIYSQEKPACTIIYSCRPSMLGRWAFVVDQSCIRLCRDSIVIALQAFSRKRVNGV